MSHCQCSSWNYGFTHWKRSMIFPIKQWCAGILCLIGCSAVDLPAQENRPRSPELEKHAEASTEKRTVAAKKKTNIVLMLMDNLGYGELGVYGGGILRGAPTPRIDKLASEGMRLLNFNVEQACTPSRSALMTGRHPIRSGTYSVPIDGRPYGLVQ